MGEILFHFKPGGGVKIEPKGFPGKRCKSVTQAYEKVLGGQQTSVPTAEMHLSEVQVQQLKAR